MYIKRWKQTKKHDKSANEAGEGHADVVGVPLGGVRHDVTVVSCPEGESHISRGENLEVNIERDEDGMCGKERRAPWERCAPVGLGKSHLRHFKSFQMIQDCERGCLCLPG